MRDFHKFHINLCCWIFWYYVWKGSGWEDYTTQYSRENGIVECPECLANRIYLGKSSVII